MVGRETMKGTTYKRKLPSGKISWCLGIDLGRDKNGRRRRIFKSGFRLEDDADKELRRILRELDEGTLAKPDPRTVADFLDQWLAEYATRKVAPTTLERYRELAGHVTRAIGTVELTKVTTLQLQRVYNGLLDSGKKNGKGLAVKTVRHVHGLVHVAMETAVKWGLLKINPARPAICHQCHCTKLWPWIRTVPRNSCRLVPAIGYGISSRQRFPRVHAAAKSSRLPGPTSTWMLRS